jgi:LmbE family N-acetylglucosaminyl deacetylase
MIQDFASLKILIVAAHPDDESIGCGASSIVMTESGAKVSTCILSGAVETRVNRPTLPRLHEDIARAHVLIKAENKILGGFRDIKFNTVPHLELVQFIEDAIKQTSANIIITHHPSDLNNDHLQVSLACQAASRIFQRLPDLTPLLGLWLMEVPSSTDWGFEAGVSGFRPNLFIEIGSDALEKKIEAVNSYKGVMRTYPHPRSPEVFRALATTRGAQAGMRFAEAFQSVFVGIRRSP